MTDDDKKAFKAMMLLAFENAHAKEPSTEMLRFWFQELSGNSLDEVGLAFKRWIDTKREAPRLIDIKDLIKPKVEYHKALPKPMSNADGHAHVEEVISKLSKRRSSVFTDWIKPKLDNPKQHPEMAVKFAHAAAANLGWNK